MTSAVLVPLLLAVQAVPSPSSPARQDPVVQLNVWPRNFVRYGEPVEVTVETARDGFLTVLRVDTHGRMHVLFPLDPNDNPFVEAGKPLRVFDRHGNQGFVALERDGEGTVLAALSETPYDFSAYTSGSSWSYTLMGVRHAGTDHVPAMTDWVREVAGGDQFEHTSVRYWVSARRRFGWTSGYRNAACFDYGRFNPWMGNLWSWGWNTSPRFYYGYDPIHTVGTPFSFLWYDDLFYSPYDCYGRRPYGYYYGGGTIVIHQPGRPGLPVDRGGFKRKKGTVVKPIEPRRRDPGTGTSVATRRDLDLRTMKPAPRHPSAGGSDPERRWAVRDRSGSRPTWQNPDQPSTRRRNPSGDDGDRQAWRDRPQPKSEPQRPAVDRPPPQHRPEPQRPAVERPAVQRPAEKPKEKP